MIGLGVALLVGFVLIERRRDESLVPGAVRSDRAVLGASALIAVTSFALLGAIWFVSLYP